MYDNLLALPTLCTISSLKRENPMEGMRFISKNMVQHEAIYGEPLDRIDLTSWDLNCLLLGPIQKGLFFPKPTPLQEKELFADNVVEHLEKTFSRALEFFYPLCGRLGVVQNNDETLSFFIDCNNKGTYFIHAIVENIMVKDILEPIYTPHVIPSFFPMNGILNIKGDCNPLLAVQVNELVDGFFIGCTMNHLIGDGSTFWHFLNSWSEISRGFDTITKLPVFNRWFPSDIDPPIRIPLSKCKIANDEPNLPLFEERVFHFSKENIVKLKEKANIEMNNATNVSSLQALLAHFWRSVIRCQNIAFDMEVKYYLIVGARPRMQSYIQGNYFGNAILVVPLAIKAGDLVKQGLGRIASRMHEVIALQTSEVIIDEFIKWVKNPEVIKMGVLTNNALFTSSSPRFNVYETDFGWGSPLSVRSGGANKSDGKITLFPGREQGSIDIEVCLSHEKLNAIGNDVEFMEVVAI